MHKNHICITDVTRRCDGNVVNRDIWLPKPTYCWTFTMAAKMRWVCDATLHTGDNRWAQLSVAPTFKMASIRVRCIRGPVQRVPVSVATRINVRYIGTHNTHNDSLLPVENTHSMSRKRPDYNCTARRNCIFVFAHPGATEKTGGRNWGTTRLERSYRYVHMDVM